MTRDSINQLHTLNPDDRDAILHIIDGLIAKNRVHQALTPKPKPADG